MKMLDTLSPQSESRQRWLLVFTSLLFIQSETPAWAPTFRVSPPIPRGTSPRSNPVKLTMTSTDKEVTFQALVKVCNKELQHFEHGSQQNHLTLNCPNFRTKAPMNENKGLPGLLHLLGCGTPGVLVKLKRREDGPSGWPLLSLLSTLVNWLVLGK